MSTNAPHVFGRLREILADPRQNDLNLRQLSGRTGISYDKLRRFANAEKSLSMEDAEVLHIELTGKTFIVSADELL